MDRRCPLENQDEFLKTPGKDAAKFTDSDMKIIGEPLDFVGIA